MYAVVPAHNEAPSVGDVVRALTDARLDGVVVVDDASDDATSEVAQTAGAEVVRTPENVGKGEALLFGVNHLREIGDLSDRVLFIDADLVGLRAEHVRRLVATSSHGYDQVAGILHRGPVRGLVASVMPLITGQRVVNKWVLDALPQTCWRGYSIEVAINDTIERAAGSTATMMLLGVTQRTKFEKRGWFSGTRGQLRMLEQIRRTREALRDTDGRSCAT